MQRRQFINRALGFAAGLSFATGCHQRSSPETGDRPERLRFAVTDVQGLQPLQENFSAFYEVLAEAIAVPVEPVPVQSFVAAPPAMLDQQIDLVLAGPSEYLLLNARAQAVPLIALTRPDYRSLITVRADSPIQTVQDLKGKVIGMRTEGSTAGHIGASQLLVDGGLDPVQDVTVRMTGDRGLMALLSGEIDAWADSLNRTTRFLKAADKEGNPSQVRTLVDGDPLPNDVFVAGPHLDPDFLQTLTNTMLEYQSELLAALLEGPENSKYKKSEFLPANDGDYDQLREVYRALGLESLVN